MSKKRRKKGNLGERSMCLYEWIDEKMFFDEFYRFLTFCKSKGYNDTDLVSEANFRTLEEEFNQD